MLLRLGPRQSLDFCDHLLFHAVPRHLAGVLEQQGQIDERIILGEVDFDLRGASGALY